MNTRAFSTPARLFGDYSARLSAILQSFDWAPVDRLAYAASRVIIGRSDDGHTVFNFSAVSGQFVQAAISNAYIPYRNESVSGTIENALAGLSGVAQAQMLNEFWPDIKTFVTRHTPGLKDKAQSTNDTFTFR